MRRSRSASTSTRTACLITNGWLQGFALLAEARAAGGVAVVEFPGYDRALRLLFSLGATLLYADWHDEGIAFDVLAEQVRMSQVPPTFSIWSPTFHNPTGLTLTHEQRWDIGRLMLQSGILIVEDDTYGPLRFEGEEVPTMFQVFGQRPVYSASLSATVAPGLRVGVWILPDALSSELATRANDRYISPALLGQATVFEFMLRGRYDSNVELVAARLRERRDALIAALERHFRTRRGRGRRAGSSCCSACRRGPTRGPCSVRRKAWRLRRALSSWASRTRSGSTTASRRWPRSRRASSGSHSRSSRRRPVRARSADHDTMPVAGATLDTATPGSLPQPGVSRRRAPARSRGAGSRPCPRRS